MGIKINPSKSQALMFHHKLQTGQADLRPAIKLGGHIIPYQEVVTFLGVALDSKLKMKVHIDGIVKKCQAQTLSIRKVAIKTSLSSETLKNLFRAYIESSMTYAAPLLTMAAKMHIDRLQKIQNIALRICYEVPSYTKTDYLHKIAKMQMIDHRINTLARNWLVCAKHNKIHNLQYKPKEKIKPQAKLPLIHRLWEQIEEKLRLKIPALK
jgi:AraC-like DNA-binding protein